MSAAFDHLLFGSLFVELRGAAVGEVVTALHQAGVVLHRVRMRGSVCTLVICLRDFTLLYQACRRHRVKIRFLGRHGLPFLVRMMRRRKMMIVGAVLFVASLYMLSSIIWQVTVVGAKEETEAAVLQAARDSGLYVGAWKWTVSDVAELQQKLQQKLPNVAWIGVNIDGTKAKLEALEKIPGSEPPRAQPCDIVAVKPGVIRRVFATRGQSVVVPGQAVSPGQVLISGRLADGVKQVPAEGRVLAEVWYTSKVEVPLAMRQDELTGRFVTQDYLAIGNLAVRVWGWRQPPYQGSFERVDTTDWRIGTFRLPIQWREVRVYEATAQALQRSSDDAAAEALRIAALDVQRQLAEGGQILGQKVLQRELAHGKLYETVLTWTEEDIGTSRPIAAHNNP